MSITIGLMKEKDMKTGVNNYETVKLVHKAMSLCLCRGLFCLLILISVMKQLIYY